MANLKLSNGNEGNLKKIVFRTNKIYVGSGKYGYGVFTNEPIQQNELVEECVIAGDRIPPQHMTGIQVMPMYTFRGVDLPNGTHDAVVVLGYGSLYNHSTNPNVYMRQNENYERIVSIIAARNINAGEELLWNYGYNPQDYK